MHVQSIIILFFRTFDRNSMHDMRKFQRSKIRKGLSQSRIDSLIDVVLEADITWNCGIFIYVSIMDFF